MTSMSRHYDIAGWMHIASGVMGFVSLAGAVLLFSPGLAGLDLGMPMDAMIFGLTPLELMLGMLAFGAGLLVLLGLVSIITGYGLLKRRPWGANTAIVVSLLQLMNVPLGTAVAAYTLWALLSEDGKAAWEEELAAA